MELIELVPHLLRVILGLLVHFLRLHHLVLL